MSVMKHVYITAHGSYNTGSWLGEAAQIGIRVAYAPTLSAPSMGDIWTPQDNGEIVADFGSLAGTNGTLARTWSARVGPAGSEENVDAADQVDMCDDMYTFLNSIKANQYSAFRWTHCKVSAVTALGKTPIVSSVYTFTAPLAGSVSTGLPPQVAMALSTRANLVGRRGRGRVYVPALGSSLLASDGTISPSVATSMRTALKTLIDNLQNRPGWTLNIPVVFIGSSDSPTVVRPVELRTGNRLDTIQSRRRQVVESYAVTAL